MAGIEPVENRADVGTDSSDRSLEGLSKPSVGEHWDAFLERAGSALSTVLPVLKEIARVADVRERNEDFSDLAKGAALDFSQRDGCRLRGLITAINSLPRSGGPDSSILTTNIDKQTRQSIVEVLFEADEFLLTRNEDWINAKQLTFPDSSELRNDLESRKAFIETATKSVEDAQTMFLVLQKTYGGFVA